MSGRGLAKKSEKLIRVSYEVLHQIQPASVRSVCYQLFNRGIIFSTTTSETQKVSRLLVLARENKIIPWEWIVDETREPEADYGETVLRSDDLLVCKDHVRARLGLPSFKPGEKPYHRPIARPKVAPKETQTNADIARWLWERREPIAEHNAAGRYLRKRGYNGPFPPTRGFLPASGKHPPAIFAVFGFCDEVEPGAITPLSAVHAVHLTKLDHYGNKADLASPKIMLGPSMGLPILLAPANGAVLFVEKEGFQPLFRAANLAEKHDIAIMSSKGMSVTAARLALCAEQALRGNRRTFPCALGNRVREVLRTR